LEAIPESVPTAASAVVDVEEPEPTSTTRSRSGSTASNASNNSKRTSARTRKKSTKATEAEKGDDVESKPTKLEDIKEETAADALPSSPPRSVKRITGKKKGDAAADEAATPAATDADAPSTATSTRKSSRKKKKEAAEDEVKADVVEKAAQEVSAAEAAANVAKVDTPTKQSPKKKKAKTPEQQKESTKESDVAVETASPKKSAKKRKSKTPGKPTEEDTKSEPAAEAGPAVETPNKSPEKEMTDDKAKTAEQPSNVTDIVASLKKSTKKRRKSKTPEKPTAESTNTEANTGEEGDTSAEAATPKKRRKERKKKKSKSPEQTEEKDTTLPTPAAQTEGSKNKKKRSKKRKLSSSKPEEVSGDVGEINSGTTEAKVAALPAAKLNRRAARRAEKKAAKKAAKKEEKKQAAAIAAAASSEGAASNALDSAVPESANTAKIATKKAEKSTKKKKSKGEDGKSPTKKPHRKKRDKPGKSFLSKKNKKSLSPVKPHHSPQLVMDIKVHRMRFLKLHPRGILAMASTPPINNDAFSKEPCPPMRLAVSREGGSVELLSPQDRWVSVGNVPGVRGREVDALVWVCSSKQGTSDSSKEALGLQRSHRLRLVDEQRHLIGCSRDGTIFELDFATKRQKGVIGSGGGGVFCMASIGEYFAAGCEDGSVKIYTIFNSDGEVLATPQLVATLPSAGNAVLSLAWVPGKSNNDDGGMGGSVIFAGVADGTIRRYDCATSTTTGPISTGTVLAPSRGSVSVAYRWKSTLRMTVENQGLRVSTKVWTLKALSDGTVISGDSLGHVQIWDGMSGTMTQTFDHNEDGADVLCLAVSGDENKIFASGIDSSVRCFQRQSLPKEGQDVTFESTQVRQWISSNSYRKHTHDVKALAICHKRTAGTEKPLELLVSGGVDTRLSTYSVKDFKSSRPKIWYNWPCISPISASTKQRMLAVTRDDRVDLFHLDSSTIFEAKDESKCPVKTISIQSPFNLSCSAISADGKFLAASDALSLYIFTLEVVNEGGILDVRPTKLNLSGDCKQPVTALQFDDNDQLICATNNGPINILKISSESGSVSLEHVFKEHTMNWPATSHHFPIASLCLSSDGKWLAAARLSSGKGAVHVFKLPSEEDELYQHWWSVPEMDAPTTCIKFLGGGDVESSLAVGCSSNEFYVYNLGRRSLSHWSNDMGLPVLKSLPKELTSRSEPVTRIVSNPVTPQGFILGSHGYFCVVDMDQPVPDKSYMFPPDHLRAKRQEQIRDDDMPGPPPQKKMKVQDPVTNTNFTICLKYNEILYQDFIAENEMVIVEEPWMSILEGLPDALARRVYGT
jgi:U3 small nucleolar RNA-associated protein 4